LIGGLGADFFPAAGFWGFLAVFFGVEFLAAFARFSGMALPTIKERKWADDQAITENNAGLTLEFSITQYANILAWVLSFGQYAVLLKSKELVAEWRENVRKMGAGWE
jgi:hypothetical protein